MKKTLGLFSISDCGGCLLQLRQDFDLVDNLTKFYEILDFTLEPDPGIVDIGLVEGRVRSEKDIERIRAIRKSSEMLILLGACTQKSNFIKPGEPVAKYIKYDYALSGCPIPSSELTDYLANLAWGKSSYPSDSSVCFDCKSNNNDCFIKNHTLCLGPVAKGGCGSICVNYGDSCIGCRGEVKDANRLKLEEISADLEKKELISYLDGKV